MIVGKKETFGLKFELIETNTPARNYGHIILFLENKIIGYYGEPISLDAVNYQFERIISNQNVFFEPLIRVSKEKLYSILVNEQDIKYDSCLLSLGESFDDFDLKYIKSNNEVRFIWKLSESHTHSYNSKDYNIHDCYVKIEEIQIVKAEFEQILRTSMKK